MTYEEGQCDPVKSHEIKSVMVLINKYFKEIMRQEKKNAMETNENICFLFLRYQFSIAYKR